MFALKAECVRGGGCGQSSHLITHCGIHRVSAKSENGLRTEPSHTVGIYGKKNWVVERVD